MDLSNLAYIATHISISESVDGLGTRALSHLVGRNLPDNETEPDDYLEWWAEAEAKFRIIKAKALLSELEKQNP